MKIYLASSWRNEQQPGLVSRLREANHSVYDFRNPLGEGPDTGFAWDKIDSAWQHWTPSQYKDALNTAQARAGFLFDARAMLDSDACVLLMPSGRSAHVEFGWMLGRGKLGYVLLSERKFEPDLMYLLTSHNRICLDEEALLLRIAEDDARIKHDVLFERCGFMTT
jgi:hypothetical protein